MRPDESRDSLAHPSAFAARARGSGYRPRQAQPTPSSSRPEARPAPHHPQPAPGPRAAAVQGAEEGGQPHTTPSQRRAHERQRYGGLRKVTMTRKNADPVQAYREAVNPFRYEIAEELGWPLSYCDAAGEHLTAADGRRFLDLVAEYGAAILGHRHPEVVAALAAALHSGPPCVVPIGLPDSAGYLAQRLIELAGPPLQRVYFCTGGAEAMESAMKFALAATGRQEFVSFSGDFHGLTPGALSLAGNGYWSEPLPRWSPAGRHQVPFGDVAALDRVLDRHDVAAVAVESIQGLGGARAWAPDDLRAVAQSCAAHGAMLIADEVLTGIGRTGRWFAFQHAGIEPDLVVVSKGLTGGLVPVSAVLMSRAVHESVYSSIELANVHSSTFEGHLLGMVAGLTVLDVVEQEGLVARAAATGARLRCGLEAMQAERIGLTGVRGHGLLIAFQVEGLERPGDPDGAATCMELLMDRGILVYPAAHDPSWLKLTPPLNLSDASAMCFLAALRESLQSMTAGRSQPASTGHPEYAC
jgi:ornithine--oxo-acid transaminase